MAGKLFLKTVGSDVSFNRPPDVRACVRASWCVERAGAIDSSKSLEAAVGVLFYIVIEV